MVMEDAAKPQTLVHVLRHSFQPSEQLATSLEEFIPHESEHFQSSVTIASLAMIALDSYRFRQQEFLLPLREAKKDIERNRNVSIPILRGLKIRQYTANVLSVVLRTGDVRSMYLMHNALLDKVPEGTSLPDNPNAKFLVTAHIKSTVPFDQTQVAEAEEQFLDTFGNQQSNKLFSINPDTITGIDQYIPTEFLNFST
jgi:hypothetical protein